MSLSEYRKGSETQTKKNDREGEKGTGRRNKDWQDTVYSMSREEEEGASSPSEGRGPVEGGHEIGKRCRLYP